MGLRELKGEVVGIYGSFRKGIRKRFSSLSLSHWGPRCLIRVGKAKEKQCDLPQPELGQAFRHVGPPNGRSGCSPAEPYPPKGGVKIKRKSGKRPGPDHPWRGSFKKKFKKK